MSLDPEAWDQIASRRLAPDDQAADGELLAALRSAIGGALSAHQREILVAITLKGVPIDVLAERLGTTRGALYKTLHDARKKLRTTLAAGGFEISEAGARRHDAERLDQTRALLAALLGPASPSSPARSASTCWTATSTSATTGADADRAVPGMRAHLAGCPACREDHDSLRDLVRGRPGVRSTPEPDANGLTSPAREAHRRRSTDAGRDGPPRRRLAAEREPVAARVVCARGRRSVAFPLVDSHLFPYISRIG